MSQIESSPSPIADLSYRNYDLGLQNPRMRWWVISKLMIQLAFKRKAVWVCSVFSAWYYIVLAIIMFFVEQMSSASGNDQMSKSFISRLIWKDQFVHGFSYGQLLFMTIALYIGAGAIANDNRANALLVYLSKPVTKLDYVIGKWVGVFIPLFAVSAVPAVLFYLYGIMSFRSYGFFTDDPWLLPKVLLGLTFGSSFLSSLIVGFSSMFNQGRMAGAAYAGLYFLTNFFTQMITISWVMMHRGEGTESPLLPLITNVSYLSVDGLNIAMFKTILGTNGSARLGMPSPIPQIPRPDLWVVLLGVGGLTLLSLFIAWRRVRAVEVIG